MNENTHITSVADVKAFFHHLVDERKLNFHPDDDFADYISLDDKTPSFADEEVAVYNRLMEESFDACEADIYELSLQELEKVLKPIEV